MHAISDNRAKKVVGTDFPPGHHPCKYLIVRFLPVFVLPAYSNAKLNKINDKNGRDQK